MIQAVPLFLTVDREGLAAILKRSPATVRRQMSECPERLPPAVSNTKPRIWQVTTVQLWMTAQEAQCALKPKETATQLPKASRGRPRKVASGRGNA